MKRIVCSLHAGAFDLIVDAYEGWWWNMLHCTAQDCSGTHNIYRYNEMWRIVELRHEYYSLQCIVVVCNIAVRSPLFQAPWTFIRLTPPPPPSNPHSFPTLFCQDLNWIEVPLYTTDRSLIGLGSWRFFFSFRNSPGQGRGEYISFSGDTCYWMIFHLMQKYLNRCFMQIYLNQGTSCRNIVQCQPCTASSASLALQAMPALHCKVQSVHA